MFENEEKRFLENFQNVKWEGTDEQDLEKVTNEFKNDLQNNATKKYVPIGTVVEIENVTKKYMIIGFNVKSNSGQIYDYIACVYPAGVNQENSILYFNHNQIVSFYHIGYYDLLGKGYQEKLNNLDNEFGR